MKTMWLNVSQTHRLTSLAFDQEPAGALGKLLVWVTDSDGYVLSSLIDESNPTRVTWQYVASQEKFSSISIGLGLKIWGVDLDGVVFYRNSVDQRSAYCGKDWTQVKFNETDDRDVRFRQVTRSGP
jgi:hypothetical protein